MRRLGCGLAGCFCQVAVADEGFNVVLPAIEVGQSPQDHLVLITGWWDLVYQGETMGL